MAGTGPAMTERDAIERYLQMVAGDVTIQIRAGARNAEASVFPFISIRHDRASGHYHATLHLQLSRFVTAPSTLS
jgi:hypothetical protein